ncbi:radical SAM family heme chaperone HemW [Curtobacterium flaccumfaciens]|uniref:radical SAM family heme chaperone HemW n=1 Tax=Curtobacterium flaccumfaciens TaxID=2035 RepID=UPI001BDF66BD|nr:radical SAM family heme chaperone HemW [Curtobacterium flaccumfaciens]MBT1606056.1 coproporphyrinogen III oxidase [Curtobacterium flaccumfaciens pv. betae]MBT1656106.1 coproporphyrinogen III oxidase [Curtobacterium flaccumfaciens pv. betae]MCS0470028.1 radical SAM family heme chaperone HemW [Curtobacterium flaccumfaciens pv. betae]MCS0473194.1 radical SAM family heme chaperone HemW [Curtobacterium flaccumfaciens pv. betae]MCS0476876.1 radical SAM family heme chaperone HemW [Curtobacterium f
MPSALPIADPAPADGLITPWAAAGSAAGPGAGPTAGDVPFGVYVHVPFCRVRCGYCDFNTYTASELRGVRRDDYAGHAVREIEWAATVLDRSGVPRRPVSTVFFGGGTPTMLPASDLAMILRAIDDTWGILPGAEVTTEANPDSVDAASLETLRAGGFNRISYGMQSAVPHVLATLDRTHDPLRVPVVVDLAKQQGLDVSLDLIYSTPGESLADWRTSLDAAIACEPDHVSAYSLIVEDGTAMGRMVARGELPAPDDDLAADMYELADQVLGDAGYSWYEVSNWARGDEHASRHNLSYWKGHDWWGVGPGAHSAVAGTRWWNVKHPAAYANRVLSGESPAAGRETIDDETRYVERLLLAARVRGELATSEIRQEARGRVAGLIARGLVDGSAAVRGQIDLTLQGRLLADAVVRELLD